MKKFNLEDMKGGWFVGNFFPTAYQTKDFEVCYKYHKKGEFWPNHYHKVATEINLLVRGSMNIGEVLIRAGEIFIIEKNEISKPVFHEDCEVVVIKVPSVIGDKYEVE